MRPVTRPTGDQRRPQTLGPPSGISTSSLGPTGTSSRGSPADEAEERAGVFVAALAADDVETASGLLCEEQRAGRSLEEALEPYRDVAGTVGDAAGSVGGAVGGAVGSVAEGAQQATGEVIDRAGQAAGEVTWRLERFMQASPLAMGAIALGAGAVAGTLLPETEQERELLGDASRQVADTVRQTVDQAASKAEEQLDKTEATVEAGSTV